ncbi:hypothetical protein C5E45_00085 [Nocardia nova]|uniref:Uncharacterized protein n=1 Tax=Nocardia nova TaxID=37330 RepID=A0A2S6AWP7_9NOCA|nr:hypothetical protein C5E41_13300 [Nocardia nova]PPJ39623.1 hypothetical protein C5E45_00085 [Nocardia nova]
MRIAVHAVDVGIDAVVGGVDRVVVLVVPVAAGESGSAQPAARYIPATAGTRIKIGAVPCFR